MSAITSDYQRHDGTTTPDWKASDEEKQLLKYVIQQRTSGEGAKKHIVRQAWESLGIYVGRQWAQWNNRSSRLEEVDEPDWRVRMTLNYTRRAVDVVSARLTENRPIPIVLPNSSDEDDQSAARACEKLIEHFWRVKKIGLKNQEFVQLALITGLGVFKVSWDKEQRRIWKGGTPRIDVLSLFEFGWDPGAKEISDCRWAYHLTTMHIDRLRNTYENAQYLKGSHVFTADQYSAQLLSDFRKNQDQHLDRVEVTEYFELPSPRYPKGLYVVIAGDVVLTYQKELPYGRLPFVITRCKPVPGRLAGDGMVPDLIPPQKEINKKASQAIENANLMAMNKWLIAEGSVEGDQITDEPGEVIRYDPTLPPPRPIQPGQLAPDHHMIGGEQLNHLWQLAGITDMALGRIPSGLSGRTIGMTTDLEATLLGPTVRELESAYEDLAQFILELCREYMTEAETIRLVGKNRAPEVIDFRAADIKSTDVRIEPNSLLPKHISYRREQLMMMFQSGILGAPNEPATQHKTRRLMEFGDMDEVYRDNVRARQYARTTIQRIMRGEDVGLPQPWEDHAVASEELRSFLQSVEFRLLPQEQQRVVAIQLAWHDYLASQLAQGTPWWRLLDDPDLPPDLVPGEEQGPGGPPQGPPMPQGPPIDAFGPEPAVGGPPPAQGIPPELMMAMMQQQGGGGALPQNMPNQPELNAGPRGPGVPDLEGGM